MKTELAVERLQKIQKRNRKRLGGLRFFELSRRRVDAEQALMVALTPFAELLKDHEIVVGERGCRWKRVQYTDKEDGK
jgi:hypothetical protein